MTPDSDLIVVGRITGAYGIKGWVKVYSYTDPMEGILQYQPWYLSRGARQQTIELENGRVHGKGLIALPAGFTSRNEAEALAGWQIEVEKVQLPELDDGELYWHQLEGLAVINTDGARLGRVDHLLETGASDVMVVIADETSIDGRERMIPFVEEDIVTDIDLKAGSVTVNWETDY